MDFSALNTAVLTTLNDALSAVVPAVAIILGAGAGYKLFRRFLG